MNTLTHQSQITQPYTTAVGFLFNLPSIEELFHAMPSMPIAKRLLHATCS